MLRVYPTENFFNTYPDKKYLFLITRNFTFFINYKQKKSTIYFHI